MKENLLGDYDVSPITFGGLDEVFAAFKGEKFLSLNEHMRRRQVSRTLYDLVEREEGNFLLSAVVDFIARLRKEKVLEYYSFTSFELWLNQFSNLSEEENYRIRAKIVGRYVPRDEYQLFFPIGMGKQYQGSHFVTAHASPDLDTTVASFWGWIDAFAARVSDGLHIWNVPGGPPVSQVEVGLLFFDLLGRDIFSAISKGREKLTLSSFDLITQRGLIKKLPHEPALSLDHERNLNAIILVDKEGYFLGDWRYFDVEGVRQVVTALENCLRWMESDFHSRLITLFAKPDLTLVDLEPFFEGILAEKLSESEPGRNLTLRQQKVLQLYLEKVLGVSAGINCSFGEFAACMEELGISDFTPFNCQLAALKNEGFFDDKGQLIEDRPKLFNHLCTIIKSLAEAFRSIRVYVERLEVALQIKREVFGHEPQSLSYRADLEEIRTKMDTYPYLTVNYPDPNGKEVPVGVIHASELQKSYLGTVTCRDFSNREETKIPTFLEVISVIDHHKTNMNTLAPPMALICDAQSSNAIVGQLSFQISDAYATGGMTKEEIDRQIKELEQKGSRKEMRILRRLLKKREACENQNGFYVAPEREFIEYLHYLFAIFDDTDLLTKVSYRDVVCVAELLNRLKSLHVKKEVEVIDFDDLPRDENFVRAAARKLLQDRDLHSLYSKVYASRESAVDENIERAASGESSNFFLDTKFQNGCNRVGQTKIFENNVACLHEHVRDLQKQWCSASSEVSSAKSEIDLHLHMISTIASAEQLVKGEEVRHTHKDELWIWVAETDLAIEHLRLFLNSFQNARAIVDNDLEVEFLGSNAKVLSQVFKESFKKCLQIFSESENLPMAVLRYKAGTLNSRKAMIAPHLPKLSS